MSTPETKILFLGAWFNRSLSFFILYLLFHDPKVFAVGAVIIAALLWQFANHLTILHEKMKREAFEGALDRLADGHTIENLNQRMAERAAGVRGLREVSSFRYACDIHSDHSSRESAKLCMEMRRAARG